MNKNKSRCRISRRIIIDRGLRYRAQFNAIAAGLEMFRHDFDEYPPSGALDPEGKPYCGAMKLCEAMVGQDLKGFHPNSQFRRDGCDANDRPLYSQPYWSLNEIQNNAKERTDPYLPIDKLNIYLLTDVYGKDVVRGFPLNAHVLCDVFERKKKPPMPILYYKAHTDRTVHDPCNPDNPENIYDYKDNQDLLALGVPWDKTLEHPMYKDPKIFYEMITNRKDATTLSPLRKESFILWSAGYDGLFGTNDDITNFER